MATLPARRLRALVSTPPHPLSYEVEANEDSVCGSNQFKNAAQWLEEGGLEDSSDRVMHCWQEPGDIIYVPVSSHTTTTCARQVSPDPCSRCRRQEGWYHAVINHADENELVVAVGAQASEFDPSEAGIRGFTDKIDSALLCVNLGRCESQPNLSRHADPQRGMAARADLRSWGEDFTDAWPANMQSWCDIPLLQEGFHLAGE